LGAEKARNTALQAELTKLERLGELIDVRRAITCNNTCGCSRSPKLHFRPKPAVPRIVLSNCRSPSAAPAAEGPRYTGAAIRPKTTWPEVTQPSSSKRVLVGERLAQAIASGGDIPALVTAMQDREHRRSHLRAELTAAERQSPVRTDDGEIERALDVMRQALTDWRGMLRQETGPARRAMQALLK